MHKTDAEILLEARDLIARPWRWIQGRRAKNRAKVVRQPWAKDADSFCTVGIVEHLIGSYDPPQLNYVWQALPDEARVAHPDELLRRRRRDIERWNDFRGRTQEQVIGLLDDAARLAKDAE